MKHETGIQWCHVPGYIGATWNPTTGCTRVSPGCDHCYAFTLHDQRYKANLDAARASGLTPREQGTATRGRTSNEDLIARARLAVPLPMAPQYDVPFSTVQVLGDERLTEPLRAKKPRTYFVDSMSDLFHEAVPDEVIDRVFAVMALSPQHLFMVLTKRPERMWAYLTQTDVWARVEVQARVLYRPKQIAGRVLIGPLPNVWLGVTVEDQPRADERIPLLLETPAAVRFLSCEPLLEAVDIAASVRSARLAANKHYPWPDWVIVGGESGKGARPFDVAWARSLRDQCRAAGVPFFMKQLGSKPRYVAHEPGWCVEAQALNCTGLHGPRLRHPHGGNLEEWPEDLRVRQWPSAAGAEVGS